MKLNIKKYIKIIAIFEKMLLTYIEHYDNMRPSKGRGTGTVPFLLQTGFEHLKIYQQYGGYKNEQTSKVK